MPTYESNRTHRLLKGRVSLFPFDTKILGELRKFDDAKEKFYVKVMMEIIVF